MTREMLADEMAQRTRLSRRETEQLLGAFTEVVADALSNGEGVELGNELGRFVVKRRDYKLNPGSPRTPKQSQWLIDFKEAAALRRRLKIRENALECDLNEEKE